jgi:hypothetical protein
MKQNVGFPHCTYLPPMVSGEAQTRSEHTGLVQHTTLAEAISRAVKDKTVWKISYATENGWQRFVIR